MHRLFNLPLDFPVTFNLKRSTILKITNLTTEIHKLVYTFCNEPRTPRNDEVINIQFLEAGSLKTAVQSPRRP